MYMILLLLTLWIPTFSTTIKKYIIRDLEYNSTDSSPEIAGWLGSSPQNELPSCGETYLMGGFQVDIPAEILKSYNNLSVHTTVYISFKLWIIDKWYPDASMRFCVESAQYGALYLPSFGFVYDESKWSGQVCGDYTEHDLVPATVLIKAPHTSNLTFHIHHTPSATPPGKSYYGIRDFSVLLSTQTVSATSFCIVTSSSTLINSAQNCACPLGKYWNTGSSSCQACDASCENCFGATSSDCYSCNLEYTYNGQQCVPCNSVTPNECVSCRPSRYLHDDLICRDSCDYPYTKTSRNQRSYCASPCDSGKYFYSNGSCLSGCSAPFISKTDGRTNWCDFPCTPATFLYPNSSCSSECISPLSVKTEGSKFKYCNSPCQNSTFFYYQNEKVCKENCPYPNIVNLTASPFYKLCIEKDINSGRLNVNGLTNSAGMLASIGLKVAKAVSASNSACVSLGVITKMLSYIKYLNVSYSQELEDALKTWKSNFFTFDFMPQVPDDIEDGDLSVPFTFAEYDITPRFLVNLWQDILILSIILGVYILARLIEIISLKLGSRYLKYAWCYRFRVNTQNFLEAHLTGCFGDFLIFSVLEFRSPDFSSHLPRLSFSAAIGSLIFVVISLGFQIIVLLRYQRVKNDSVKQQKFAKNNEGVQMFYGSFQDKSLLQQASLFFFVARDLAFGLILTTLFEYCRVQSILITVLNALMLIFLLVQRPFKDLVDLLQQLFCELMLMIVNVSVLIMAIADPMAPETENKQVVLGKVIIIINIACSFGIFLFLIIQAIIGIRNVFRRRMELQKQGRKPQNSALLSNNRSAYIERSMQSFPVQQNNVEKAKDNTNVKGPKKTKKKRANLGIQYQDNSISVLGRDNSRLRLINSIQESPYDGLSSPQLYMYNPKDSAKMSKSPFFEE